MREQKESRGEQRRITGEQRKSTGEQRGSIRKQGKSMMKSKSSSGTKKALMREQSGGVLISVGSRVGLGLRILYI